MPMVDETNEMKAETGMYKQIHPKIPVFSPQGGTRLYGWLPVPAVILMRYTVADLGSLGPIYSLYTPSFDYTVMASLESLPEEHVKVWCRLRGAAPQDDVTDDADANPGAGSFLTGAHSDELDSCFESYDAASGEVVYRRGHESNGKRFRVDGLLGESSSQAEAFSAVGVAIVDGCLEGYNGAILVG